MNFEEFAAKPLLETGGVAVPRSELVASAAEASGAAKRIGPCVVKAQVPTGKRGKAGGIQLATTPEDAATHAANILGMEIGGHRVERLLIEAQVPIDKELYAAVLNDPVSCGPVLLFSPLGGMDVEEAAEQDPNAMRRLEIDISTNLEMDDVFPLLRDLDLAGQEAAIAETLVALYGVYRSRDAELLEVNPLVLTKDKRVVALDCKLTVCDSSIERQEDIASNGSPDPLTDLEAEAAAAGLKYIELGGSVGVLANGAGLTMTTMDAITHYGGSPSNFLEIGGEAYTKSETALRILLKNPNIKSLLVNFCGAFARTDVMAGGVVEAWKAIRPDIPVFFTIHGTGEDEAVALVKDQLGIEPFDLMDDAVKAAVAAASEVA
ncbi:MAG: ATP-grasp domain-containing protein [Pseudomonadota bacterium]